MSLRALIEAKQRRTVQWPLLVGNPSAAAAEVDAARRTLMLHEKTLEMKKASGKRPTAAERKRSEELGADLKAALERFGQVTVNIELQALPDDEWEALFSDIATDEDGDLDISPIHAVLLAASCTDPELQDPEWWAEQLKLPHWSKGDRATLSRTLLELNVFAPQVNALGKG